jgi:CO/xanthine dehydrogenase FAD-binding subunit
LLALDAVVELVSAAGRRQMPLAEFIVGNRKTSLRPDEILAGILIPRTVENSTSAFLKLGARRYLVISISMVAALIQSDDTRRDDVGRVADARVAVGSCSARARRLGDLEKELVGLPCAPGIGDAVTKAHLSPLSPIDDVRATAEYRHDASLVLVRRALEACVGQR